MTEKINGDKGPLLPKKIKEMKQSNHEEYTLPVCMIPWAGEPLYLVIARWCLQQNRWINPNDISVVFRIPKNRASFQLSYISRKKDRVVCRIRNNPAVKGLCRHEIWVDRIFSGAPVKKEENVMPRLKNTVVRPAGPNGRRVGNGMNGNTMFWEQMLKQVREGKENG
ncbi:CaiF/GrlA family transcriptional regulator [Salmonella enterica subsp. enterica serovar Rubislaw]|nr:CaiF/GrlA family transcriptional regulator [Salmonella enterica subsp. enterica serovar Kiambu]EEO7208569.1 CaiF/GrlA family transcriptional regulator [Salmonella enterica subsp. enterica serovar Rubislaw]